MTDFNGKYLQVKEVDPDRFNITFKGSPVAYRLTKDQAIAKLTEIRPRILLMAGGTYADMVRAGYSFGYAKSGALMVYRTPEEVISNSNMFQGGFDRFLTDAEKQKLVSDEETAKAQQAEIDQAIKALSSSPIDALTSGSATATAATPFTPTGTTISQTNAAGTVRPSTGSSLARATEVIDALPVVPKPAAKPSPANPVVTAQPKPVSQAPAAVQPVFDSVDALIRDFKAWMKASFGVDLP